MKPALRTAVQNHTAGSPTRPGLLRTHLTVAALVRILDLKQGIRVSWHVVKRLLGEAGFKTRRLVKSITLAPSRNRDAQFQEIKKVRRRHERAGNPVFSMDSKKKEALGRMHRAGRVIADGPAEVLDHDLPHYAQAEATPHGIYDVGRNRLHVTVTKGSDTGEFAVASFRRYWLDVAAKAYPEADSILLLCDCGGSNGFKSRTFKYFLWQLAGEIGIPIRVAHYPVHCSKYDPIERRAFPHVEQAFSGCVFDSVEMVAERARDAETRTGLRTTASVMEQEYVPIRRSKIKIPDFPVARHHKLPEYNYTLKTDSN